MTDVGLFLISHNTSATALAAERLFCSVKATLEIDLPSSSEILHVGATAVPGCLTKGDLDIAVRVDPLDFQAVDLLLSGRFNRNKHSTRTSDFSAFEDISQSPHLGIQLTKKDGELDMFHHFAAALRADVTLLKRYNTLKLSFHNRLMTDYRIEKRLFIENALRAVRNA